MCNANFNKKCDLSFHKNNQHNNSEIAAAAAFLPNIQTKNKIHIDTSKK